MKFILKTNSRPESFELYYNFVKPYDDYDLIPTHADYKKVQIYAHMLLLAIEGGEGLTFGGEMIGMLIPAMNSVPEKLGMMVPLLKAVTDTHLLAFCLEYKDPAKWATCIPKFRIGWVDV